MKDPAFDNMSQYAADLLRKAQKTFGQAEVLVEGGTSITVQFDSGRLTNIEKVATAHLGLRVIHKGRLGVTGTIKPIDINQLIKEAKASAKNGDKAFFSFPRPPRLSNSPKTFSLPVTITSVNKMIIEGQKAINFLKNTVPEFLPRFLITQWSWGQSRLLNSAGINLLKSGTHTDLTIDVSRNREGDFFEVWESSSSRRWDKTFLDLAQVVAQKIKWGMTTTSPGSGPFTVIFPPKTVSELLEYFETATNGREVNDRSSRFAGKIGQKLFDPRFSLIDSGLEDWQTASESFDDEGVAVAKRPLVQNGVLKSFLYDLQEAGKAKAKSTGSAIRTSVFHSVRPSAKNLLIQEGTKPYSQILSGIKKGIFVDYFVGSGQGNQYNGDFSLSVAPGYLVNHGQIVGRVKGVGLAGNIFDLLKDNLIDLSRETEWHGPVSAPYLVLSGVGVSSKS